MGKRKARAVQEVVEEAPQLPPLVRDSDEPVAKKKRWTNKQRVLIFGARGMSFRDRHLMQDLRTLMPHSKADSKKERKDDIWMINEMGESRFLHVGQCVAAVDKGNLAKLRKRTGFSISNCKKALEMHENNIEKAEAWLQAEAQAQGWAKATKLSGRTTTQGLVGVHIEGFVGALVEVNCETDFVARNEQFKALAAQAAKECATASNSSLQNTLTKECFSEEQMRNIVASDGKTLADHLALAIGVIGENMSLPRGTRLVASEDVQLFGYSHPSMPDQTQLVGRLGAILALKCSNTVTDIARQLCQHVVGMNPQGIGTASDPKASTSDDETLLVHQEFLSDPSRTVGEVLEEENIEVVDFIRFECGELKKVEE